MRMVIATKTEWNLGIGPPVCVVIRILAYRDIAMGVKFDSEASWILDKDP